ncbi:hypothetical protein [Edaphobacter aggregans]|uniref:hypothetical protein n=1 Tax=Edaphobacter aggregans TaxID=570835 RepID=UPI0012F7E870|nr:hypothetical protein [Edaphobacter aggregans]
MRKAVEGQLSALNAGTLGGKVVTGWTRKSAAASFRVRTSLLSIVRSTLGMRGLNSDDGGLLSL